METFRIPDAMARLEGGAMLLSTGERIFHVLSCPGAASMVGLLGRDVPVPLLFQKFGSHLNDRLPLYERNRPELSLLRILLSPHPYALSCYLCIGAVDPACGTALLTRPVVRSMDFRDAPVLPDSKLVSCESPNYTDFQPVTLPLVMERIPTDASQRRLYFDEEANMVCTFDPNLPTSALGLWVRLNTTEETDNLPKQARSPKSILKSTT
ncbi:UL88 [Colobine gammaherpesvirus 1]|uniref:UL88 n=1 Tax=Colobine gammaherpesvirus 1 TaxID=2597325 RepID=A0A5B8G3Y5_9GAMA|nr:UL88 [Colobine gammaherpesvirus 1]QDQ69231.1 UL88 [Colobine gammaherpesvirus 1]